jgi:membrane protein YdbS with pleckstrin-like domain
MTSNNEISPDMWQSKPWWCQPWTIILTGVLIIAGSWLVLHTWWITIPLGILIGVWWLYFLVIVPQMLRQMAEEQANQGETT